MFSAISNPFARKKTAASSRQKRNRRSFVDAASRRPNRLEPPHHQDGVPIASSRHTFKDAAPTHRLAWPRPSATPPKLPGRPSRMPSNCLAGRRGRRLNCLAGHQGRRLNRLASAVGDAVSSHLPVISHGQGTRHLQTRSRRWWLRRPLCGGQQPGPEWLLGRWPSTNYVQVR